MVTQRHILSHCTPHNRLKMFLEISLCLVLILSVLISAHSRHIDFISEGGVPRQYNITIANHNTALMNSIFASLQPGDVFIISNTTFYVNGGISASQFTHVEIRIYGELMFNDDRTTWPVGSNRNVLPAIYFNGISHVTFTSSPSSHGIINGNGQAWWGLNNLLTYGDNRPRLFYMQNTLNITFEYLLLKNAQFWSFYSQYSNGLVVRYCEVDVRYGDEQTHDYQALQAFNTDGFDVTGKDVHMHDLQIWNSDDCISVKDGSENMLFERINASGVGLAIGSIGNSIVRNITFRDSTMYNTVKGIYMKTRWYPQPPSPNTASITDILYENITMYSPEQWAIWIGPAQQTGQPCSLFWPGQGQTCIVSGFQTWANITLRDIFIFNPTQSPGILLGNSSNPMKNVVFDNVVVHNPGVSPFNSQYYCQNIRGSYSGQTYPVPQCFGMDGSGSIPTAQPTSSPTSSASSIFVLKMLPSLTILACTVAMFQF